MSEAEVERDRESRTEDKRTERIKEIEGVVFVPQSPGSKLKEALHTQDEVLARALNIPSLSFVERSGTMVIQDIGQSDPWATDQFCPREDCWHCQGRLQLH